MNEPTKGPHPTPAGSINSQVIVTRDKATTGETDSIKSNSSVTGTAITCQSEVNEVKKSQSKYAGSRFKQETFWYWDIRINLLSLAWYLLPIGIVLCSMGLYMYLGLAPIHYEVIPYTNCESVENRGVKCSRIVDKDVDANCSCVVRHNITANFQGKVFMYFNLTNFHQNQREYVMSLDEDQLQGKLFNKGCKPKKPDKKSPCQPERFRFNRTSKKLVYPCGIFANSFFSDDVIQMTRPNGSEIIHLWKPVLASGLGKRMKYRDPLKESPKCSKADLKKHFSKPDRWPTVIWDRFINEGGASSDRFFNWMRPAAFSMFTVPHRYFVGSSCKPNKKEGICRGNYTFHIQYRYDTATFNGEKSIILFQKRFITDDSGFIFVASIAVGTFCCVFGFVALIFFFMNREAKKSSRKSQQAVRFSNASISIDPAPEPMNETTQLSPQEIKT